jgi:hypothetical protein
VTPAPTPAPAPPNLADVLDHLKPHTIALFHLLYSRCPPLAPAPSPNRSRTSRGNPSPGTSSSTGTRFRPAVARSFPQCHRSRGPRLCAGLIQEAEALRGHNRGHRRERRSGGAPPPPHRHHVLRGVQTSWRPRHLRRPGGSPPPPPTSGMGGVLMSSSKEDLGGDVFGSAAAVATVGSRADWCSLGRASGAASTWRTSRISRSTSRSSG